MLYGTISKGKPKKTKGQHQNQKRRPLRLTAPGPASCFLHSLFQAAPRPASPGNSKQYRRIFPLRRTEQTGIFEKWTRKRAERSGASAPRPFLIFFFAFLENFECPWITVCINLQQIYNPRFQEIGGCFYCGQSALRLVVSSGCIQRTA